VNCLACITLADAQTFRAQLDTAQGYPKNAVDIGGGVHASAAESRTLHGSSVIPNPTLPTAAVVPFDARDAALGLSQPIGATVQAFDPLVWYGASVVLVG
jgi:hypothetical protein